MDLFEKAILIATKAHSGQIDKGGNPYILHPINVMIKMSNETERIVALLHDVIEDTTMTYEDLRNEGFGDDIIIPLKNLTKKDDETYMEFIKRAKIHPISKNVKMEDVKNNMDITRIKNPTEKDYARIEKYKRALNELLNPMDKRNIKYPES